MFKKNLANTISLSAIALAVCLTSCHKEALQPAQETTLSEGALREMIAENGNNPDENLTPDGQAKGLAGHYVYTESNYALKNSIIIYKQHTDGTLSWYKEVASGGAGNNLGLASQGAITMDSEHKWLYAVNAGDNTVSSFLVNNDGGLTLAHTVSSGGTTPVSVATYKDLLYVTNSASADICGFSIGSGGTLTKIAGSAQPLSAALAGPAQIQFHPKGKVIYVTEKTTNKIAVFKLGNDGAAGAGSFISSTGEEPFGFSFAGNYMVVSNAAQGVAGAGSATSYATGSLGAIHNVNGAIADYAAAPCWVATTKEGRLAFVTNTMSNTISSYYVAPNGKLYYIFFAQTPTGIKPADLTVSTNNLYVYNINETSHTIGEYKRGYIGTLNKIGQVANLPAFAVGLVCN